MLVVFDTNILVSALLSTSGSEAKTVSLWHSQVISAVVSAEILTEYHHVLHRQRLRIDPAAIRLFLAPFLKPEFRVVPTRRLSVSPDEKDNRFLECAEASSADYLITGNLKHFPTQHGNTRIVRAPEFLSIMNP